VSPLTWHVDTGPESVHVAVHGRPDADSIGALHAVLRRHGDRRPGRLTIDLSEMRTTDHAAVIGSALPAQRSSMTSGTAVLHCCSVTSDAAAAASDAAAGADRRHLYARMNRHLARAGEAFTRGVLESPSVTEPVLPVSGTARHARDIVTHACRRWNLPHLTGTATLVASELVSYAIRQVPTMMTVGAMMHHDVLYLWVRGGARPDSVPRQVDPHLELVVVHALASRWGFLPDGDDTVTWAALPVPAAGSGPA
jgi:hypothetical protein